MPRKPKKPSTAVYTPPRWVAPPEIEDERFREAFSDSCDELMAANGVVTRIDQSVLAKAVLNSKAAFDLHRRADRARKLSDKITLLKAAAHHASVEKQLLSQLGLVGHNRGVKIRKQVGAATALTGSEWGELLQ